VSRSAGGSEQMRASVGGGAELRAGSGRQVQECGPPDVSQDFFPRDFLYGIRNVFCPKVLGIVL